MSGTVQKGYVQRLHWVRLTFPFSYYSVLGYEYEVNGSTFVGEFILGAADQSTATSLQEMANGRDVSIRYDADRPDNSFVVDDSIVGQQIYKRPRRLL